MTRALEAVEPKELQGRAAYLSELLQTENWRRNTAALLYFDTQTIAQRANNLDALVGSDRWKVSYSVLGQSEEGIRERAAYLTATFEEGWKAAPGTLSLRPETVRVRTEFLDGLVGDDRWRRHPPLINLRPELLAERAEALSIILENDTWRKWPSLLGYSTEKVEAHADVLTEILGNTKWRKAPDLLAHDMEVFRERAKRLTKLFGNTKWTGEPRLLADTAKVERDAPEIDKLFGEYPWKSLPRIARYDLETLRRNSESHTRIFGSNRWKRHPLLVTVGPRTFASSIRALRSLGFGETEESSLLLLSCTTTSMKRQKSAHIRQRLLGHRHVYLFDEKIPLGEYVEFRASLTSEERESEKEEVAEFSQFLIERPTLMLKSVKAIDEWAKRHGYPLPLGQ